MRRLPGFFLDLCALLGMPNPADPDTCGFERGATRTAGWADYSLAMADDEIVRRLL